MDRRGFIAALGVGFAGCAGDGGDPTPAATPSGTPTRTPSETRTETATETPTPRRDATTTARPEPTPTATPALDLPEGYYAGPMVSAHEHLLFMPERDVSGFVDWMDRNRVDAVVGFGTPEQLPLLADHPDRFVPFDQAPFSHHVLPRVVDEDTSLPPFLEVPEDPPALAEFPAVYREHLETDPAWQGIGELGLYLLRESDGTPPLPDADWLMELYAVAAEYDVTVMLHPPYPDQFDFHPWEGDPLEMPIVAALRRAFEENPDTAFLVHGFRRSELDVVNPLLERHDNWHYDVSGIMNGHPAPPPFWTGPSADEADRREARERVLDHMTVEHVEEHVASEYERWESILTTHPDRVLWGIDAGRRWHFHPDYLDVQLRFYRGVLGRLSDDAARAIAHENATRLWL